MFPNLHGMTVPIRRTDVTIAIPEVVRYRAITLNQDDAGIVPDLLGIFPGSYRLFPGFDNVYSKPTTDDDEHGYTIPALTYSIQSPHSMIGMKYA